MNCYCSVCGAQLPVEFDKQLEWSQIINICNPEIERAALCPEDTRAILLYIRMAAAAFKK
jgi:hypothetical protein